MNAIRIFNLSLQLWGTVMSLVIILCMFVPNRMKRRTDRLYVGMLVFHIGVMLMDALALYFRGRPGLASSIGVRASNFLSFFSGNLLVVTFLYFERAYLERKTNREIHTRVIPIAVVLLTAQSLLLLINLIFPFIYRIDARNIYERLPAYPVNYVLQLAVAVMSLYLLWSYREQLEKWEIYTFLIYILTPFVGLLMTVLHYGIAFTHIGNSIVLVTMYVYLQAENGRREAEREADLSRMRVSIMMSQIQPHFLFNALNSIEYLCNIDSKTAGEAVHHFAYYLRRNMDSVTRQTPVAFREELAHLENYLYIEHIRFPHIKISYDLAVTDFQIPALTVQPIVENAIKHGLADEEDDARITIETYEDEKNYYVRITDNGCGFEPDKKPKDGRQHVGVENTRKRLQMMCGGELEIKSELGKGTCALVKLPKEGQ